MLQMAVDSDHVPNGIGPGLTGQLYRELELAGVEPLLTLDSDGALAGGVTLLADAGATQTSDSAAARFRQQAFDTLANGLSLSVSVHELGEGTDAHAAFSAICELLRLAMQDAGASPECIAVAVKAEALSPQAAWAVRSARLGGGPVHVLPGRAVMQPDSSQRERDQHDRFWSQLWHAHGTARIGVAYAPTVFAQCSLLSAEVADCVLPATAVQVPAGTAWLPMSLDVSRFTDERGSLRESAIEHALGRSIEIGDVLHDLVRWPTARMQHDAWLNRRLAIVLTGFGDLVQRRRQDPQQFASLTDLCELLRWIREVLQGRSREVARRTEHLPALEQSDPCRALPSGHVRNGWRTRWREAVESAAVRHRNVVVLSPWSLFPRGQPADFRYADLLPLLGFANACSFPAPPSLCHWNINKFKNFHQRAWAVLQQRGAVQQIAERL